MQSHGKSENNGGLRGHFSNFTNLVDDLQLMVAGLGEEWPGQQNLADLLWSAAVAVCTWVDLFSVQASLYMYMENHWEDLSLC